MYFRLIKRGKSFAKYINSRSDKIQDPSGSAHQRRFIEFWQYRYTAIHSRLDQSKNNMHTAPWSVLNCARHCISNVVARGSNSDS